MSIIQHYIKVHSIFKFQGRFNPIADYKEAITLVSQFRIKAEIIGEWIYCFTTEIIGVQLLALGFWYSFKHNAFVYSGSPKDGLADDESLDEIRARLGSQLI